MNEESQSIGERIIQRLDRLIAGLEKLGETLARSSRPSCDQVPFYCSLCGARLSDPTRPCSGCEDRQKWLSALTELVAEAQKLSPYDPVCKERECGAAAS